MTPRVGEAIVDRVLEEPGTRLTYRQAAEITPTKPEWLWRGWLLLRALNLLAGRQGSGKTTWVSYVVSCLTNGQPLPDADTAVDPIRVGILSLEEPPDRIAARLHAAGADLDCVLVIGDVEDRDDDGRVVRRRWQLPKDIAALGRLIVEQSLRLVIVDGLGYSITGDSHNYAVVGSALSALAGEADRTGAAILGLVHPPKGSSDPVTAAIGSTAWTAIPRVSIVLGNDPNDETGARRVVRVAKSNYRLPDAGLSFTIGEDATWECGFVANVRASHVSAEDVTAGPETGEQRGERAEARSILRELLADGPMDAKDAERASGFSERTLRRARKDLGVVAEPRRNLAGQVVGWTWKLPDGQTANTRRPMTDWPSGPSGHTQGKQSVSAPDGQRTESGRLDDREAPIW